MLRCRADQSLCPGRTPTHYPVGYRAPSERLSDTTSSALRASGTVGTAATSDSRKASVSCIPTMMGGAASITYPLVVNWPDAREADQKLNPRSTPKTSAGMPSNSSTGATEKLRQKYMYAMRLSSGSANPGHPR
jgi:hypothetical protein